MPVSSCPSCHQPVGFETGILIDNSALWHPSCLSANQPFTRINLDALQQLGHTPSQTNHLQTIQQSNTATSTLKSPLEIILHKYINNATSESEKNERIQVTNLIRLSKPTLTAAGKIHINSDFDLSLFHRIQEIPEEIELVKGELSLNGCPQIKKLPTGLSVEKDLDLSHCDGLENLPEHLHVHGSLYLNFCTNFASIPDSLKVGENLTITYSKKLQTINGKAEINDGILINRCDAFSEIDASVPFNCELKIKDCANFKQVPDHLEVKYDLHIDNCPITTLPDSLIVKENLKIDNCNEFTALPQHMNLGGGLIINRCSAFTQIPDWVLTLDQQQNQTVVVDLTNTALPQSVQAQLEARNQNNNTNIVFITDLSRQNQSDAIPNTGMAISTTIGQEARDILKLLASKPGSKFYIIYKGEYGIDQGGLTRQALSNAFKQFRVSAQSLFDPSASQGLSLLSSKPVQAEHKDIINKAQELGLLLSAAAQYNVAVGPLFSDQFFPELHMSLATISQTNKDKEIQIDNNIHILLDSTAKNELLKTLENLSTSNPNLNKKMDYLKHADLDFVQAFAYQQGLYLTAAQKMIDAGFKLPATAATLATTIAGPTDIKSTFLERIKISTPATTNELQDQKFKAWIQNSISQASPQELQALLTEMTGSPFMGFNKRDLHFKLGDMSAPNIEFEAHTCSFSMNINEKIFNNLLEENQFATFKTALLSASSNHFNIG